MRILTETDLPTRARPTWSWLGLLLAAGSALLVGIAVAAVGAATSPLAIVALPLAAFWLTAVLARPVWGPAAFFLAMPFGLERVSSGSFQVIDLVAIVAVGAVVLARTLRPSETPLPFPWVLGWGVALCALGALSLTSALDQTLATDQLIVVVASFALACAVVAVCEHMQDVRILVAVFLAVGCVMSIAAFTTTTSVTNYGTVVQTRSVGFFQDPNELGSLAAMLLVVALGVTLSGLPRWYRMLGTVAAVLATAALALSLSRGAWLGAGAGIVALAILIPKAWRVLAAVAVVGLLLGLTLGAFNSDPTTVEVLSSRFGQILHPIGNPYDQRTEIWKEAEREIAARPWLGYGPNNFAVASARSGSEALTVGAVHAHNVLLTVGAELGLPAVGVLIAFTLALGWAAWRTRQALRGSRARGDGGRPCGGLVRVARARNCRLHTAELSPDGAGLGTGRSCRGLRSSHERRAVAQRTVSPVHRPYRVVVVHGGGWLGGSETWLARVLPAAHDLEVRVVLLSEGPFAKLLRAEGLDVTTVPTGRTLRDLVRATRHIRNLVRNWMADVIVADGVKAATLGVGAAPLARVPVVWIKHDHAYDHTLGWVLARTVRAVAGTSTELVAAAGRPHAPVLPVPRPSAFPVPAAEAIRYWQSRAVDLTERPVAVFVGRLVPSKGVETLIRALATEAALNWRLVVVGDDDAAAPGERRRLESIAASIGVAYRVTWAGAVREAGAWLAAFDAVVVPTGSGRHVVGEGFGLVVLEGLLAGVPIAASAGIPALRLADGAAVSFQPDRPDDLGQALAATRRCTDAARQRARRAASRLPRRTRRCGRLRRPHPGRNRPRPPRTWRAGAEQGLRRRGVTNARVVPARLSPKEPPGIESSDAHSGSGELALVTPSDLERRVEAQRCRGTLRLDRALREGEGEEPRRPASDLPENVDAALKVSAGHIVGGVSEVDVLMPMTLDHQTPLLGAAQLIGAHDLERAPGRRVPPIPVTEVSRRDEHRRRQPQALQHRKRMVEQDPVPVVERDRDGWLPGFDLARCCVFEPDDLAMLTQVLHLRFERGR